MTPKIAYLVSHTHWDREWYLTFHRFRANLVSVVKRVLDALENDPQFNHFCLDGQSIVLDDYLEACPEDRDRVHRLIESGALAIGPWYILPDEFLIGPEATVRNLVIGHKSGAVQKVGYMPDSFGHIAQVPQILRGAGIDSFIYTRGNGDEIDDLRWEYLWRAPDGSEVTAHNQCGGYCNAAGLGFEEIWHAHTKRAVDPELAVKKVGELFEKMSSDDVVLLNNGCDHFPPQQDFGRILGALREAFPQTEFRHGSFADFLAAVGKPTKRFEGELCSGKLHHILSGVWSARMPLKQRNDEAQTLLADCLEPTMAYLRFVHGHRYPHGEIEYAWRLLLQNQPHDSICGCSTDEVHRDMEPRFDGVIQTAEQLVANGLREFAPTFAPRADADRDTVLCVMNPLPVRRRALVERLVVLQPFGYDLGNLALVDDAGNAIPFEIVRNETVERFWGIDYRMELFGEKQFAQFQTYREQFGHRILDKEGGDHFLTVRFLADLPALGHVNYHLVETGATAERGGVKVDGNVIENEHCRVVMHPDGTFDLDGLKGLNRLEDGEDIGDEYDYSPCPRPELVTAKPGTMRIVDGGGLAGRLEAAFTLELPAAVTTDRQRRSDERVDCPVRVQVGLTHGSPVVSVDVFFENHACDHRLRAAFPTGIETKTVRSDGHFYVNERPIAQPDGENWVQPPLGTVPQQEFSALPGFAVLNRGLPEMQADESGTLWLTLLRSVGWLSRDDFPTRRCQNAGPTLPTPEAQCLGAHHFRYAVVAGDHDVKALSRAWRTPVPCVQGVKAGSVPGGSGLLEADVQVTAVKRHEERDTLVVRMFSPEATTAELKLAFEAGSAWRVNLLEERESQLEAGRVIRVPLRAHEIATVEIQRP